MNKKEDQINRIKSEMSKLKIDYQQGVISKVDFIKKGNELEQKLGVIFTELNIEKK